MRSQEQRDQQTLDIASAVFGAPLLWFVPLVVLAVVEAVSVDLRDFGPAAFGILTVAYFVTVVVRLRSRIEPVRDD